VNEKYSKKIQKLLGIGRLIHFPVSHVAVYRIYFADLD